MNSTRLHVDRFVARAALGVSRESAVLDAGAGICQYRHVFSHARYEAADFAQVGTKEYGELDMVCDLRDIPRPDSYYDAVLFTQTLEHLPDPPAVLGELHRVMKVGARIYATAPFLYQEHEQPHDYFRYTRFGFSHLLLGAGFKIEELGPLGGYFGAAAYQLEHASRHLPRSPRKYGGGINGASLAALATLARPCFRVMAGMLSKADIVAPMDADLVKGYSVIAIK